MAEISNEIKQKILDFYKLVKGSYPVEKVFIFGSYAQGKQGVDSDIDVGVVVDMPDHTKRVEITANLLHCANKIDTTIEPRCLFLDEYKNPCQASILSEIVKTGIDIV